MSENLKQKFDTLIANFNEDHAKSEKGNKAASIRARKALMDITKLSKLLRIEILESTKEK